ncbi:hypothetical protein BDZ89DRAFT_1135779 [Hymenopellis radicata]|nr:hypothetical protein BDZ89DRAFT_1135779 [Hymenopellis radicata]
MDSKAAKGKEKSDAVATKAQPTRPMTRAASSSYPTAATSLTTGESRIESLRSNKGYQYTSTPGDSRPARRRAPEGPEVEQSPSREPSFPPPSSRARPPVSRQPFDVRNNRPTVTRPAGEFVYPPFQNPLAPSTPQRPDAQATAESVADSSSAVPVAPTTAIQSLQGEFATANPQTAQPSANDVLVTGTTVSQPGFIQPPESSLGPEGPQSLDLPVERVQSVASDSTGYAASFVESIGAMYSRRPDQAVRVLLHVGKSFNVYDEDLSVSVAKYHTYTLFSVPDPLLRFGVSEGRLGNFTMDFTFPGAMENISSAINDRLEFQRRARAKDLTSFKITNRDRNIIYLYSVGDGSNEIGYWGHLVLAVTQVLETFQEELGFRSPQSPPFQLDPEYSLIRTMEGHTDRGMVMQAMSNLAVRLKLARSRVGQYINALRQLSRPNDELSDISSFVSTIPEIRRAVQTLDDDGVVMAYSVRPDYRQRVLAVDPSFLDRMPFFQEAITDAGRTDDSYYLPMASKIDHRLPTQYANQRHVAFDIPAQDLPQDNPFIDPHIPEPMASISNTFEVPRNNVPAPQTNPAPPMPNSVSAMLHYASNNPATAVPMSTRIPSYGTNAPVAPQTSE